MKKILILTVTIILTCVFFLTIAYASEDIRVRVNGNLITMDQPPILYQDRTLIPLRAIGEALGCEVTWDDATQTANLSNSTTYLSVQIGNYTIGKINRGNSPLKVSVPVDVPAMLVNNRTMVPLRAIAEAYYLNVEWDDQNNLVIINKKYDKIGYEMGGYIRVDIGDKMGFMDLEGNVVIPIEYDNYPSAYEYVQGKGAYAIVKKNGNYGAVDMGNNLLVDFIYSSEESGTTVREKAEEALALKGITIPEKDKYGR